MFSLRQAVVTAFFMGTTTIVSAETWYGIATWYQPNGRYGACGAPSQNFDLVVALPPSLYANGANCWKHLGIINSDNGAWVDAVVVDLCPDCEGNHIDMSSGAFSKLSTLDKGVIDVTWYYE
ncbi:Non-catalytic module family EXPN protein [Armillaria luteobubalina]|uniref:Non-catalytic module family EXPN protein n=1 Tax=Armillaria luteobubalina TaxID=153913 RepID=A0AA39UU76_9AGAR|nr:Non-catalytic module family EXPN protein [Armillaria luteobubalina]